MNSLVIIGRRWFNGDCTKHTASIIVDGEQVARTPITHGYDRQYEETAAKWLEENGYILRAGGELLRECCERNGVAYHAECVDVARRRDL